MQWIVSVPIAHRGLHSGDAACPENSLPAFEAALRAGYAIELDVHLSADRRVVVFHDDDLERMTGRPAPITGCSWGEIRRLRLLGTAHGVPSLEDVLDLVDGKVPLLVEIKDQPRLRELCAAALQCLRHHPGPFAVQSFNPRAMGWFARHAPQVPRGQISGDFRGEDLAFHKKFLLKRLLLNRVSRPHFIAYDHRGLPTRRVARARSRGLPVLAWTVRSEHEAARAMMYSDNVIFEGFRPGLNPG